MEEFRVGGVIAGWCFLFGALGLVEIRLLFGAEGWSRGAELVVFTPLGVPLITAILLMLNPNYSGHLVGGFSSRILRLPVDTWVMVAVTLILRTVFVFLSAALLAGLCHGLFDDGPTWGTVLLITCFYLALQVLDWVRAPVSGLTSLLLLAILGLALSFLSGPMAHVDFLLMTRDLSGWTFIATLLIAFALAYGIALPAVWATRVGRRVGIPEVWEWPGILSVPRPGRLRPFGSPLAAGGWYEFRRSGWFLPLSTFLFLLLFGAIFWMPQDQGSVNRGVPILIPGSLALLLASAANGLRQGVQTSKRATGKSSFRYFVPSTTSELALARVLANGLALGVTLFAIFGIMLVLLLYRTEIASVLIFEALAENVTSIREIIWFFLARGILIGLIAWALTAIGTRLSGLVIGVLGLLMFLAFVIAFGGLDLPATPFAFVLVIAIVAGAYRYAWSLGLMTRKTLIVWVGVWVFLTFLIYPFGPIQASSAGRAWLDWGALLGSVAFASLGPFPFIAVLLDIHKRRHSRMCVQNRHQQDSVVRPVTGRRRRLPAWTGMGCAALFLLWVGWPRRTGVQDRVAEQGVPDKPGGIGCMVSPRARRYKRCQRLPACHGALRESGCRVLARCCNSG